MALLWISHTAQIWGGQRSAHLLASVSFSDLRWHRPPTVHRGYHYTVKKKKKCRVKQELKVEERKRSQSAEAVDHLLCSNLQELFFIFVSRSL